MIHGQEHHFLFVRVESADRSEWLWGGKRAEEEEEEALEIAADFSHCFLKDVIFVRSQCDKRSGQFPILTVEGL